MSEKKEWLKSEVEELISIYHSKPELWDIKSKIYRDRLKKRSALSEISEKFETTIEEVSRKIHNLRNQFNSELKKSAKRNSGQSIDELYVSKWPYFKSLSFLQGDTVHKLVIENIKTIEDDSESFTEEASLESNSQLNELLPDNKLTITQQHNNSLHKGKSEGLNESEVVLNKTVAVLHEPQDHYDIFGKYVASELRNLSSEYLRRKMKRKFQEIILEINVEEEHALF